MPLLRKGTWRHVCNWSVDTLKCLSVGEFPTPLPHLVICTHRQKPVAWRACLCLFCECFPDFTSMLYSISLLLVAFTISNLPNKQNDLTPTESTSRCTLNQSLVLGGHICPLGGTVGLEQRSISKQRARSSNAKPAFWDGIRLHSQKQVG